MNSNAATYICNMPARGIHAKVTAPGATTLFIVRGNVNAEGFLAAQLQMMTFQVTYLVFFHESIKHQVTAHPSGSHTCLHVHLGSYQPLTRTVELKTALIQLQMNSRNCFPSSNAATPMFTSTCLKS